MDKLKKIVKEEIRKAIKEESKMIDLKKWWEYEPKKIMSFVYWQARQVPPTDPLKWNKNWQDIIKQLNHKYPAPELDVKRLMTFKK